MNHSKFVKLWLTDRPTPEIARDLNHSVAWIYQTAKKLRTAGVQLPERQVTRNQGINVDRLNAIINERTKHDSNR